MEKQKKKKIKELLVGVGFFLINTGMFLALHIVWVNVVTNLLGISMLAAMYTKSIKRSLFVTACIYLMNIACDVIPVVLFVDYIDGQEFNQIYAVITVFLFWMCELIVEKIVSNESDAEHVQNLPLILVPLASIVMIVLMIYLRGSTKAGIFIMSMGLFVIDFLVLYLYDMLSGSLTQKYENEALRQKVESYTNQMNVIMQSEGKVKSLRHDMKHHLNEIKLLAINRKDDSIQEYIDSMTEFIENPDEIVSSGNAEIDSVLNYLLKQAKEQLDTVEIQILLPKSMQHSFDVNVILGNLLDNAIEAARQTTEKILKVNIHLKQGILKIEIENSFNGKTKGDFRTTKKDKELHGIGLNNVRKMVEKYHGEMDVVTEGNMFVTRVILYIE